MWHRYADAATLLGVLLLNAAALSAQETASDTLLTVNHYLDWERVGDPQISPDGSQIVYARSRVNQIEDRWDSELWLMNADGSKPRFLVKGSSPRWSSDGTRIAYLAEGEPKGTQIFVRWMDAEGATSQITRLTETPSNHRWSPDGRVLAFVMLVPEKETWSISMPPAPEGATWTEPPRMIDRIHYRLDRVGFSKPGNTHLFVVPADGGTARQITRGAWSVGARFSGMFFGSEIDWAPDGKTIVFDGVQGEGGVDRYAESYIYGVDVATGAVRQLVSTKGWWHVPRVSPDGRRVVFSGYQFTTQTYRAEDLYVVGIDGQGMAKISGELDRDPSNVTWAPDGRAVYFTAGDRGSANVYRTDLTGRVQPVTSGVHMLSLASVAQNGTAVGVRSSFQEPPDVARVDLARGGVTRLTEVNGDVLGTKRLGQVEEIWYTSTGNTRVQGWIVKPPAFDRARKYPLVLDIHGGPHGMYHVGFDYGYQNYAANGYVVLYTNPRGSTGYG
ncbi:MAG: S9 family peptidase, partial [Gemmatimonadetes bacterium]|nr:S9 family peptidase [Gemmatimonadota bacterium]